MAEIEPFEPFFNFKNEDKDVEINLHDLLDKYTYYWKWFILSILVCLIIAFLYLRYTYDVYEATASILINEEQSTGLNSELSAFQDLGLITGPKSTLINEIGIIKSKSLMTEVAEVLDLNVAFFHKGEVKNLELYQNNLPLKLNFIRIDSSFSKLDTTFSIIRNTPESYLLKDANENLIGNFKYGKNVETNYGLINILPNNLTKEHFSAEIIVKISRLDDVAANYSGRLLVEPQEKSSSILVLKLKDNVPQKSVDILNQLIFQYNKRAIDYKNLLTNNTDKFINDRILEISNNLNKIDESIESYKIKNQLTDIEREAGLILEYDASLDREIFNFTSQIKMIDYLIEYLNSNQKDLIPVNLGINDQTSLSYIEMYNKLLVERNRLIKNSSSLNPAIVQLDEQLFGLRKNLLQGLNNVKSSFTFSLEDLRVQSDMINSRRSNAPKQEREYQDIKRSQQIVESLYLYLLEKREENAISLGVPIPMAQIVDNANDSANLVGPNRKMIYIISLLLGLLFPIIIISIKSLFNKKIHATNELSKILTLPILGDIPKIKSKQNIVVSDQSNDSISEAFRLLRTNLSYMLPNPIDHANTIIVTSSIGGEGKSFVSLNLASVLSANNKRILLVEADLRKPKLKKYTGVSCDKGLTHFLANEEIQPEEIVQKLNTHNIDLICAGEIPPNPANLLSNERILILLNRFRKEYDYIILDTPPAKLVTDTLILSNYADLIIYIVRANFVDKRLLKISNDLFRPSSKLNIALLLNSTDPRKGNYGYSYGYK